MPEFRNTELRSLILDEFNGRAAETPPDLENCSLRGADLQRFDLSHTNLRGAYLRSADLRGCDLFSVDLDGASLHGARISGVRFPRSLSADEIRMSVELGTRLRTTAAPKG
jgi:uncharacterized protein YjbI with pentapeptide repeats